MTDLTQCIRSLTPGRVRIRHAALKELSPEALAFLTDSILSVDGILEAQVNPRVGSLLVRWDPKTVSQADLLESAQCLLGMFDAESDEAPQAPAEPAAGDACTGEPCCAALRQAAAGAKDAFSSAGHAVLDVLAPVLAPAHSRDKLARTRRVTQNRLMLAGLAGSIAALAVQGGKRLHVGLGAAFLALLAVHLYQHRKVL